MKKVNLGCGKRYHSDWINLDFNASDDTIISYNLLNKLPFETNSVDAVYTSHVLEHFNLEQAQYFVKEIFRVLKPDGILRIAVPDLEKIVHSYILQLEEVRKNQTVISKINYQWSVLELFDQIGRITNGGEISNFIKTHEITDNMKSRWGDEIVKIKEKLKHSENLNKTEKKTFKNKIKFYLLSKLRVDIRAEAVGRFVLDSGERHLWMYDSYSLSNLLSEIGFLNVNIKSFNDSSIPNWEDYNLEIIDGAVLKPDSLILEAIK